MKELRRCSFLCIATNNCFSRKRIQSLWSALYFPALTPLSPCSRSPFRPSFSHAVPFARSDHTARNIFKALRSRQGEAGNGISD